MSGKFGCGQAALWGRPLACGGLVGRPLWGCVECANWLAESPPQAGGLPQNAASRNQNLRG
jgi:hypothetical protein